MHKILLLMLLLTAPAYAEGPAAIHDGPPSAGDKLDAFAKESRISAWPRIYGCHYDRNFNGIVVGLVLQVRDDGWAYSRWGGYCHVPINHKLFNWPAGLKSGRYVVAATYEPHEYGDRFELENHYLKIISVLGNAPADDDLYQQVLSRICSSPPVASTGEETDVECERAH